MARTKRKKQQGRWMNIHLSLGMAIQSLEPDYVKVQDGEHRLLALKMRVLKVALTLLQRYTIYLYSSMGFKWPES